MPCLQDLPNEILYLVASHFHDLRNLINLSLTSKTFYVPVLSILKKKHFTYRIGPQWPFEQLPSTGEGFQQQIAEDIDRASFTHLEWTKLNIANSFLAICHSRRLASNIRHATLHIEPDFFMPPPQQGHVPNPLGYNYVDWDAIRKAVKWLKFPAHVTQQLMHSLSESGGDLALTIVLSLLLLPNLSVLEVLNLDFLLPGLVASWDHAQRPILPLLKTLFFSLDRSKYKPRNHATAVQDATLSHFLRCPSLQSISVLTTLRDLNFQTRNNNVPTLPDLARISLTTSSYPRPSLSSSPLTSLSILRLHANHELNDLEKTLSRTTDLQTFRYIAEGFTTIDSFHALEKSAHSLKTLEFVDHRIDFAMQRDHRVEYIPLRNHRNPQAYLTDLRPYQVLESLRVPAAAIIDMSVEQPLDLCDVLSKRIEVLSFYLPRLPEVLVRKTENALIGVFEGMEAQPGLFPRLREIRLTSYRPDEIEREMGKLREVWGRVEDRVALTFGREAPITNVEGESCTRCYNYGEWESICDYGGGPVVRGNESHWFYVEL